MTASAATRVLICDDHEVVREGLRTLLSRRQDMAVVGEAGTMQEAIETAAKAKPDVVIMDVRLPDGSGVEACRAIREARPETHVQGAPPATQLAPIPCVTQVAAAGGTRAMAGAQI